jgi:hypothetical protein
MLPALHPRAAGRAAARAALALALAAPAARACASCCVLEDPLVAVSDAAARGRSLRLALDAETLSSRAAMAGMEGMEGLEEIRQRTLRVAAVFSPLDRVNVVLAVPFASREWSAHGRTEHAAGLGDLDAGVRIAAWRRVDYVPHPTRWAVVRAQAVALSAGASLPTGANDVVRAGARLDEHAQLGTGGFGPYVGALYRVQQDPWELVASASARFRTANARGYRYARGLLAGAELQRRATGWLSLGGGLDVRWASADQQDGGAPVPNTGGVLVSAIASASARVREGLAFRLRAQVPAVARLAGDQRPGATVTAGVQIDLR